MADSLPGSVVPGSNKTVRKVIKLLLIAALIIVIGWFIHDRWGDRLPFFRDDDQPITGITITPKQQIDNATKYADNALKDKEYQGAVDSYFAASGVAFAEKDYKKSKALLEECISKVPDAAVPWFIYSSMYATAKQLNDTELQKSSLQTAIKKASAAKGVSKATISNMKDKLEGLE